MTFAKMCSFVPAVLMAMVVPALGQDAPVNNPPRAYLIGTGGAAVDLDFEHPSAAVAVEYGERLHRDVQAYANLGFVNNVMSDLMRAHLGTASDLIGVQFAGRDRALTFTMGGKFLMPADMRFRPYVGAGFGLINVKRRISEREFGDTSDIFYEMTGLNDGVINAGQTSVTKPLGEVLLGAGGAFNRTYVDIAYRYRYGFHAEPVKVSQLTFGVGVAF